MAKKEHFYTAELFESAGIDPFKEHVTQYLDGQRTVPVSRTQGYHSGDIFFTLSDPLLLRFLEQPGTITKPYEVALKYGFRGYSTGGRNGIFLLQNGDGGLIEAVDRLALEYEDAVREYLAFSETSHGALRRVKIVYHEPSGERVVGVYNTSNSRMLFLDFARY